MKIFWNKLIKNYRKYKRMEQENYIKDKWLYYIAQDEQRKIKKIFYKNFKKDIDKCDYM